MKSKSNVIESVKFTKSELYDGGQTAKLNQEFAQEYKKRYVWLVIVRLIVDIGYVACVTLYGVVEDALDENVTSAIDHILIIFGCVVLFFLLIEIVFVNMMARWIANVSNFSPKE